MQSRHSNEKKETEKIKLDFLNVKYKQYLQFAKAAKEKATQVRKPQIKTGNK